MNEITGATANAIRSNDVSTSKMSSTIEEILEATRGVTGPQAATIVGTTAVIMIGACYALNKFGELVKGNCIKDIDLKNKKISFKESVQRAAA